MVAALHVKSVLDRVRDLRDQRGEQQVCDGHRGQRGDGLEGGRLDAVAHIGQLHHAEWRRPAKNP